MRLKKQRQTYPSEHVEQAALVRWAALHETQYPTLRLLFAIPNGGKRHIVVARKLVAEGVKAGVPDLCLPVAHYFDTDEEPDSFALFIEMKRHGGKPTTEQIRWHALLREQGYRVEVCDSWVAAALVICDYLGLTAEQVRRMGLAIAAA